MDLLKIKELNKDNIHLIETRLWEQGQVVKDYLFLKHIKYEKDLSLEQKLADISNFINAVQREALDNQTRLKTFIDSAMNLIVEQGNVIIKLQAELEAIKKDNIIQGKGILELENIIKNQGSFTDEGLGN
jgi:biopolymer transport protein ExbB/TolQ